MGHYRSEMGFEDSDAKRRKERSREMEHLIKCIQEDIDAKGYARVLAELLEANNSGIGAIRYPMRGRYHNDS